MSELCPIEILNKLADSMPRYRDGAFWILMSAAAHLNGDHHNPDGSTAEHFFWRQAAEGTVTTR